MTSGAHKAKAKDEKMHFTHTDERQMLADTLEKFIANEVSISQRLEAAEAKGYVPETWTQMAELGVIGALFDEDHGGFGGSGFDLMVVFQALGQGLVSSPMLESAVLVGQSLVGLGRRGKIEEIIAGSYLPAFAHFEPTSGYSHAHIETTASPDGDGWRLSGLKNVVKFGASADGLLVSANTPQGLGLFAVKPDTDGVSMTGYQTIDAGQAVDLKLDNTPAFRLDDGQSDVLAILERSCYAGMVAVCAEALGIMQVLVDMTKDYLKTRKQFGVELAKFQALQHRFVEMTMRLEDATSATISAANALEAALGGDDQARRVLHAAKVTCANAATQIGEEAVQMHGGIAVTWEFDLNHFFKRLTVLEQELGDEEFHLGRFIATS